MRVWYFSEMAYHPAWEEGLKRGSLRVVLPSSNFDPKLGHGLLNRYLDEFALCDEVGLDIIPAAGHFPHWEQPQAFVERLSAFVDRRNL